MGSLLFLNFERFRIARLPFISVIVKLCESTGRAGGLPVFYYKGGCIPVGGGEKIKAIWQDIGGCDITEIEIIGDLEIQGVLCHISRGIACRTAVGSNGHALLNSNRLGIEFFVIIRCSRKNIASRIDLGIDEQYRLRQGHQDRSDPNRIAPRYH